MLQNYGDDTILPSPWHELETIFTHYSQVHNNVPTCVLQQFISHMLTPSKYTRGKNILEVRPKVRKMKTSLKMMFAPEAQLVQALYGLTLNKLQHKLSQLFPTQKSERIISGSIQIT